MSLGNKIEKKTWNVFEWCLEVHSMPWKVNYIYAKLQHTSKDKRETCKNNWRCKTHNQTRTNLQSCNMIANHQLCTRHIKPIAQLINFYFAFAKGTCPPLLLWFLHLTQNPPLCPQIFPYSPLLFLYFFHFFFTSLINKSIKTSKKSKKKTL
jgi:hypothetical protein